MSVTRPTLDGDGSCSECGRDPEIRCCVCGHIDHVSSHQLFITERERLYALEQEVKLKDIEVRSQRKWMEVMGLKIKWMEKRLKENGLWLGKAGRHG